MQSWVSQNSLIMFKFQICPDWEPCCESTITVRTGFSKVIEHLRSSSLKDFLLYQTYKSWQDKDRFSGVKPINALLG